MKVLLISPYHSATGGITKWAHIIVEHYIKNNCGVQLEVLSIDRGDMTQIKSGWDRIKSGIRTYIKVVKEEKELLKKGFDVVHICSSASIGLIKDYILLKAAKKKGAKAVVHFHFGRIPQLSQQRGWEWIFLKKVVSISDAVIVLDQASYDVLQACGLNAYKVPNPLDPQIATIINNTTSSPAKKEKTVLFVGHCYKEKGVVEFAEACSRIPNLEAIVMGGISDEMRNTLKRFDPEEQFLKIFGAKPFQEVITAMKSCGVFVLPSYTEGFPNVILEAMACGCPIVATDVGAIPEMLDVIGDRGYGICIKPKDVDDLELAIRKMIEDKEYAEKCGSGAKQRVNDVYSIEKVWSQLNKVWSLC